MKVIFRRSVMKIYERILWFFSKKYRRYKWEQLAKELKEMEDECLSAYPKDGWDDWEED